MKRLFWIVIGWLLGVAGVFIYQVFGKAAEPDELYDVPDDDLAEKIDVIREAMDEPKSPFDMTSEEYAKYVTKRLFGEVDMEFYNAMVRNMNPPTNHFENSLADTQPVKSIDDLMPHRHEHQWGEMILGDSHVAKRNEKYNETISDESESGKIVCSKCGVVYRGSVNLREICTVCGKILIESEE